jgi:hypothetical protein
MLNAASTEQEEHSMRPEGVYEITRRCPFVPYRIDTTNGKSHELRHPDQVLVVCSRLAIGVGDAYGIHDHAEHVALMHVVRIEEMQGETARK